MKVSEITHALEAFAPLVYQENYDNCGLQVGTPEDEVQGVLLALDVTEAVVAEAIEKGCNLIIAHHPLIFGGVKQITGRHYTERIIKLAIKHDVSIYAAHTNMDNVWNGVNHKISERLGLIDTRVLAPKRGNLFKLYTYVPESAADTVREALFAAGAGQVGDYEECSFNTVGTGTFRPGLKADPAIGTAGGKREWVDEVKIEVLMPPHVINAVLQALTHSHPYEEVAYEVIPLHNINQEIGAGMVGALPHPMEATRFLEYLKERMQCACVRHTALPAYPIRRIAVCGGSGSFLLPDAIKAGADVFVSGDFKYHQFFDADGSILIADIGHFESEQFTVQIFQDILKKKFPNFAPLLSTISTNPINYYH